MANTIGTKLNDNDYKWYSVFDKPIQIHGLAVAERGKFYRLPLDIIDSFTEKLAGWARCPAGA